MRDFLAFIVLILTGIVYLIWQVVYLAWCIIRLPFRHWKAVLLTAFVGGLSFINIASFMASIHHESLLDFEMTRLGYVNDAQRFAQRALGIAELETIRADDLDARLELAREELQAEREWNGQLRARLEEAGIHAAGR